MKKLIICLVVIVTVALSACNSTGTSYEVTVVKNEGFDQILGWNKAVVVTENGDSIEVLIDEALLLNNKLPFTAMMGKNELGRFGYVKDSTSTSMFDVTVIRKADNNPLISGNRVFVTTKSGMLVESFISEEILLENQIPFPAKMDKGQTQRFGSIK